MPYPPLWSLISSVGRVLKLPKLSSQSIRVTPEGAAFGRDSLYDAINSLVEKGVIAKTPVKVRTEDGRVKNKKNGGWLIGTPEKIKEYDSKFS